ncbi:hypothetical protein LTS10_008790 [Elasticomyces elasticus]|nr:hypothetical protein LTS10_008790 [Elasticomyces elasticus]
MDLVRLPICRHCLSALRRSAKPKPNPTPAILLRRFISAKTHNERLRATPTQPRKQPVQVLESLLIAARSAHTVSSQDLNALHTRVLELSSLPSQNGQPIEEQRVLYILEQFQALAADLISGPGLHPQSSTSPSPQNQDDDKTATSALLGSVNARPYPSFISQASLLNTISERAETLARHPDIFLTPSILRAYVGLQTLLHQPSSLPDIFDLYARKPIPTTSPTGKTTYSNPSPTKINSAIPSPTANLALDSAIASHDLSLALDIITTSFCAPAYKRAKILRQAMIPLSGLVILPLAAYTLSSQYASFFQSSMSPGYATGVAFTGIMAYVVHVTTIGNDQMDRVTWAQGVPLWERWIREEERAAIDRVAGKWGFEGREQRGEEEGEEWGVLREYVGTRGMELDRKELMEGME